MLVNTFRSGFFEVGETDKAHIAVRTQKEQTFGPILEEQASRNGDASTMMRFEQANTCE